jgi:hypothetical protein
VKLMTTLVCCPLPDGAAPMVEDTTDASQGPPVEGSPARKRSKSPGLIVVTAP